MNFNLVATTSLLIKNMIVDCFVPKFETNTPQVSPSKTGLPKVLALALCELMHFPVIL